MRTVEVTRNGDVPVAHQLSEMRAWMLEHGIAALLLEPTRILRGRVGYRATFSSRDEAERFLRRFDEIAPPAPGAQR